MKKIIILFVISCVCIVSAPLVAQQYRGTSVEFIDSVPVEDTSDIESEIMHYKQIYGSIQQPLFVPGELVVNFHSALEMTTDSSSFGYVATSFSGIDMLNKKFQVESIEKVLDDGTIPELENCYLFRLNNNTDIEYAAAQYARNPEVAYAEPNYLYYHCMIPNDPFFGQQWALHNTGQTGGTPDADIDAPEAWDIETGNPEVVIAVIDTGVDYTNPDSGNYTSGVTVEPYVLESPHPLNSSGYQTTVGFPDSDAVSFHFSQFNVSPVLGLFIKSPVPGKLFPKQLFYSIFYHGIGDNLWTRFSEYGGSNNITIQAPAFVTNQWGFSIDKVEKIHWRPLHEMSPLLVDGYDYYYNNPDPMDDNGHGTHCAGIIAATMNNAQDVAGIAPNSKIMPIKICGPVIGATSSVYLARALSYAVSHDADIISMSLGGPKTTTMNLALTFASKKGVILIAAAGNDNMNKQFYPAGHPDVISVAATDQNDSKAYFSNFGSWVDVAAPGVDIVSLRAHGTDMYLIDSTAPAGSHLVPPYDANATSYLASGTSMACPHAAGVAGLILSKNPTLTASEVRTILRSSTDPVHSSVPIGTGRINAYTALVITAPVVTALDRSLDDQIITKGTVEIRGIAQGADFHDFDIGYAFGIYTSDDQWISLVHSTTPTDGKLGVLDTKTLREGLYTIRLLVNASGHLYKDLATIVVDNQQNTFYVDDDNTGGPWYGTEEDPFNSIQYAIECCGIRDEIKVASGVYKESLSMGEGKSLQIHGEDKTSTILLGDWEKSTGLSLSSARFCTFEGFTLTKFFIGISMSPAMGNRIYNNRISDSSFVGIAMMYCLGNMFYENDFINNTNHTFGFYNLNLWYNPLKLRGNYWDDYTQRYPDARPRILCPWSWNFPYKPFTAFSGFLGLDFKMNNTSMPKFFRYTWNNDRFPLINPS
jgi:parallel beta-helix repeat protein